MWSDRYYDGPIAQRRLAAVSDAAVLHIAPNGEQMRGLLQMRSQYAPAPCAEERSEQVPAVDVVHLEAIRCSQMQVLRLDALLLERDLLIWPRE